MRSPQRRAPLVSKVDGPLRYLEGSSVPRSKEENHEFIQSWLQQTRSRLSRLPGSGRDETPPQPSGVTCTKVDIGGGRKRARSPPEAASKSLGGIKSVQDQFEKRARYQTHVDKYDDKARVRRAKGSDYELRAHGMTEDALWGRGKDIESEHTVSRLKAEANAES